MLSDEQCIFWDKKGLFVFLYDTCASYSNNIKHYQALSSSTESSEQKDAFEVVQSLYDIEPLWVPVVYSDKNLHFWEAACSWMQQEDATDTWKIWIQLRKCFLKKNKLYFLYQKSEVLAHEYVHACRYSLHAKRYEEFFAYYTSFYFANKSPTAYLRGFLGPLFSSPKEAQYFLLSLVVPSCALILDPFFSDPFFSEILFCLPFLACALFGTRLLWRWKKWYRCKKKISLPLMVRLTDEEIEFFSTLSQEKIIAWIGEARKTSFRWQELCLIYCNKL